MNTLFRSIGIVAVMTKANYYICWLGYIGLTGYASYLLN